MPKMSLKYAKPGLGWATRAVSSDNSMWNGRSCIARADDVLNEVCDAWKQHWVATVTTQLSLHHISDGRQHSTTELALTCTIPRSRAERNASYCCTVYLWLPIKEKKSWRWNKWPSRTYQVWYIWWIVLRMFQQQQFCDKQTRPQQQWW